MDHFRNTLSQCVSSPPKKCQLNFPGNLSNFIKDEGGSTTAEFVLWVPVFMLFFILTADVSMALFRYSNVYYVARHTARQVAIRQWTIPEAISYATERATYSGVKPIISVRPSDDFQAVNVFIEVPINTVGIYPTLTIGKDIKLVATATENIEWM